MPAVVVAINVAIAAAASYVVTSAVVLNFILAYGVQTILFAASIAYSAAQQRKLKKALSGTGSSVIDQGRTIMSRDPIAPRRLIYGQCLVSGPIAYMQTTGTNNEYLHLIIVLAAHECHELGDVYFNDELVPLSSEVPSSGTYVGFARVKKFVGLAAGERDTDLETESGGDWTSSHLGKSVARLHVRLKYSADIFPNGLPVIKCLVKGKKVYDPRTSSTAWSDNAALCVGDFLMDATYGKGIALPRIRDAEWQEAANISDEDIILTTTVNAGSFVIGKTYSIDTVGTTDFTAIGASANTIGVIFTATGAGSGTGVAYDTEKRYTCNGTFNSDQDPNDTLLDMAGAMAGHICDSGGQWTIRAGAWRTPSLTLTDGDIVGPVSIVPRQSRQDSYNGVRGTFISPINQWAPSDFPAVKNDTYKANDGGVRLWKDVVYNYTTSAATAQRLAKIDLEAGRQQIIVSAEFMLKAMQCQPGDVVSLTRSRMGWSSKYFEVAEWAFKIVESDGAPKLAVALTLRETAEGVWDWADGEETAVDLAPNTSLYDPRTVATPSGLSLNSSSYTIIQPDGTTIPKVRVSWTAPTDEQVLSGGKVEIEYRVNGTTTWLSWADNIDGTLTEDFLTDVKAGIGYDVRIRFRNVKGVRGAYSTVSNHVVAGDSTAPATPTGLAASAGPGCVILDWADNNEDDLNHYEVFRNTSNSFGGSSSVFKGRVSNFADYGISVGPTYYYWVKAYDHTGNASIETSSVNGVANDTTGPAGPTGPTGATGPTGPALTYSLTIYWHTSGLGGGNINGSYYSGTSTTVTGLNPGSWVTIDADDPVNSDPWLQWSGGDTDQLESSINTNSNRVLMGGNLTLYADY